MTLMLLGMTVYGLAVVMLSDSETSLYSSWILRLRLGMTLMLLGMTVYWLAVVMLSDSETSLYGKGKARRGLLDGISSDKGEDFGLEEFKNRCYFLPVGIRGA